MPEAPVKGTARRTGANSDAGSSAFSVSDEALAVSDRRGPLFLLALTGPRALFPQPGLMQSMSRLTPMELRKNIPKNKEFFSFLAACIARAVN